MTKYKAFKSDTQGKVHFLNYLLNWLGLVSKYL